ncbi:DMT family transporter [Acidimicrobium ferrooxidans]|uniref:DMT family transporter n=1 Tax=Acidimicrobium ferrooxidans TaxID=53635 RepID=A0ABS3ARP1_9ACTN|nr:DMT family transporter [Acidimicrobium ferrooxidans]
MDVAVALALIAGVAWAVNIVIVRWALDRTDGPPLAGAFVGVAVAAVVTTVVAVVAGGSGPTGENIWQFALTGAIAPGASQGLFVSSIESIGPARSSVLVSTNPVWSVALAIFFLDEGWRVPVLLGTALVVVGGVLISWEPGLGFRHIGVVLALIVAVTFGVRDVVASQFTNNTDLSVWWAASIVLTSASLVVAAIGLVRHRQAFGAAVIGATPSFVWSGVAIAIALTTLFGAFDRSRVGVVAPLSNAAQSVAVVVLGAAVFGAKERTPRILAALVLVIAGGALITAT